MALGRKLERFRASLAPGAGEETTRYGSFVDPATGATIPYVDKLARIFKAGVHRGKPYTEADIDRLVRNFPKPASEIEWDRPIYKDHNPECEPAIDNMVGNVRSLERRGAGMSSQLWGWIRFIGEDACKKVASGMYRKLSAGIFYDTMELDEVSVLPDPYFTDTQIFSKNPKEAEAVSVDTKKDPAKDGDAGQGTEKHSQGERPRKKRPDSTLSAVNDKWEERFSKMEAVNKQLVEQLAAAKTELAEFRSDKIAMTADKQVEVFRAEGKTTKAMAEPEKKFVATLTPEQFGLYQEVKKVQPEFFSLETYGDPGEEFGTGAKRPGGNDEDVKAKVKSLKEKYNKKGGNKDA